MTQNDKAIALMVAALKGANYKLRPYSGRGMSGKECLGVRCDDPATLISDTYRWMNDQDWSNKDSNMVVEALGNPRIDQLGNRMIAYWPHIKWEESKSDE